MPGHCVWWPLTTKREWLWGVLCVAVLAAGHLGTLSSMPAPWGPGPVASQEGLLWEPLDQNQARSSCFGVGASGVP